MSDDQAFQSVFNGLKGQWQLERTVSDGSVFSGEARFEPLAPQIYLLSETGHLRIATGEKITASRHWVWQCVGGSRLKIFYDEDPRRLYHDVLLELDGSSWQGSASHSCPPDQYSGVYSISEEKLLIDQRVSGPKKNYTLNSIFTR